MPQLWKKLCAALASPKRRKAFAKKYTLITLGSLLAAAGLQLFLVPNSVIDGGVVGLSIMFGEIFQIPFNLLLVALNLPFVILAAVKIGLKSAVAGCIATLLLSVFSGILSQFEPVTGDPFLSAIFGGVIDGMGVGLIVRSSGFTDGSDVVAMLADRNSVFSVGEVEMLINFFILGGSGFLFGWDHAMYSLVAYFIISRMLDYVVNNGINESYLVFIVTGKDKEIASEIMTQMNRGVTFLHGEGAYTGDEKRVLYTTMTRFEIDMMKDIVNNSDEKAFVTLSQASEIAGGRFSR